MLRAAPICFNTEQLALSSMRRHACRSPHRCPPTGGLCLVFSSSAGNLAALRPNRMLMAARSMHGQRCPTLDTPRGAAPLHLLPCIVPCLCSASHSGVSQHQGLQPRLGFAASAATLATMRAALCCALLAVLLACTGIDAGKRGWRAAGRRLGGQVQLTPGASRRRPLAQRQRRINLSCTPTFLAPSTLPLQPAS